MTRSWRDDTFANCRPDPEIPFPREEYRERLAKVRARMDQDGIDCLFLTAPESLCYVSGYQAEWYQAQSPKGWPATSGIAVHRDHDRFILFETQREQVLVRCCTVAEDVRIFPPERSLRDGTGFIAAELAAAGWLRGTLGLEFWSYRPNRVISQRFEAAFAAQGARVVDGSDVLREVRFLKSPAELDAVEEAARIADIGLAAARDALRPGAMELEVYGAMVHAMARAGGENPGITMPVLSGRKANCGHAMASRRRMQAGEMVFVDVCGVHKRYHANEARTFCLGEPPREARAVAEKAAASVPLIRDLLRPSLPVGELIAAVRAHYEANGIWSERSWLGGYELGIAFPPDWVGNFVYDVASGEGSGRCFAPGAVVNYENQFVMPEHVGAFVVINTLLFKEDAASMPSRFPCDLQVVE